MNRGTKGLEMWCRRQIEGYPGVHIQNMTTSWKNGMAFCALVHHFRPDLIDFDKLNRDDVYYNNELAFRLAENHLGIPALLDAADMAMYDVPDRLSILTYLSQYYQRFASQESKLIPSKDKSAAISNATPPPQKDEKSLDIMGQYKPEIFC